MRLLAALVVGLVVCLSGGQFIIRIPPGGPPYTLPNDDAGCPTNCRLIPWKAGSDLWNSGTLPVYTGVDCSAGLTEGDGTTDNTTAIEACLAAVSSGQASVLPVGMFYVNASLDIPSNKVLRGKGAGPSCAQGTWITASYHGDTGAGGSPTCTTLKLGITGTVNMPGSPSLDTAFNLASGYTKGSTAIVTSSTPTGLAANDFLLVSELEDSEIPSTITGDLGACTWCGEANALSRPMTQLMQASTVSGTTVTLSRPLYYTFKSGLTPRLRKILSTGTKAGLEDLKLWGSVTTRTAPHIDLSGCMLCWVQRVETYDTPDVGKAYPIYMAYGYGNEIRDSYFHFGQGNGGDRNYGIGMFGPNSDHKVENMILRENRHSWSQEGGGSGNVFLYNYVDDNYTDDATFLGSPRVNHGAHPYFALFEGNVVSHFASDEFWGSSSHTVIFRNWLWGDATGNYAGWTASQPSFGFVAMEIDKDQHYYAALGNVLGHASLHTTWSGATVHQANCTWGSSRTAPMVFGFGCVSQGGTYDAVTRSSMILHGNYDLKTAGVADWDGGSNHTLANSLYYPSKPSFYGACTWPPFDGTSGGTTATLPAEKRYANISC